MVALASKYLAGNSGCVAALCASGKAAIVGPRADSLVSTLSWASGHSTVIAELDP